MIITRVIVNGAVMIAHSCLSALMMAFTGTVFTRMSLMKSANCQERRIEIMNKIQALAFDLDGTLFDANIVHFHAFNKALKELHNIEISFENHKMLFDGLPTKRKIELLIKNGLLPVNCDAVKINELKQEYTIGEIASMQIQDERLYSVLSYFKNNGKKLACVSNAVPDTVYFILQKMRLLNLFDVIVCNDDIVINKPAPDCYLWACNNLSLVAGDVLVIEDNQKGFDSAISAGCHLYKVSGPEDITIKKLKEELWRIEK
jgi:beta-phosphoglucomutase-like phosphatase (HAD superfamily)